MPKASDGVDDNGIGQASVWKSKGATPNIVLRLRSCPFESSLKDMNSSSGHSYL